MQQNSSLQFTTVTIIGAILVHCASWPLQLHDQATRNTDIYILLTDHARAVL